MADNRELVVEPGSAGRGGAIAFSGARGALVFEKFGEMVDFSIYMSKSDKAVPAFLRGNAGACMAITVQASEWGFSPFSVARMAYVVNDQIAYMSQLIHSVVEKRANLKQRLRATYSGEGLDRQITISGHFVGEVDPLEYTSPKIRDIKVKNSPLWTSDPDQQLFYFGSRAWARRYCPDVLLGVYAEDELPGSSTQGHIGADNAKDVTPETEGLQHRLSAKAAAGAGFDPGGIAATLNRASGKGATENSTVASRAASVAEAAAPPEPPTPVGIVDAAAVNSPTGSDGDASAHGGQAQETAAATPTSAAAVEPQKRRGRPPKAAAAPVEPAAEPTAPDTEQDDVPLADPESPAESAPQEHVPPAHEDVAGLAPAASEDDELPDDDLPVEASVDRVPDPPKEPLPEKPRDGRYYNGYLRKMLMQPRIKTDVDGVEWWSMDSEADVRAFWGSYGQKTIRNGIPNFSSEIMEKAKGIIADHIKALKAAGEQS